MTNAFMMVRPKSDTAAKSAAPKRTARSRAPMEGHLRDLPPAKIHDAEEARRRYIENAAEVALKVSASKRKTKISTATPAERARSKDNNRDKV